MQFDIRMEEEEEYLNNPHHEEEEEIEPEADYEEYEVQIQGSDDEDVQNIVEMAGNAKHTEGQVEDEDEEEDEEDDMPSFLPGTPLAVSPLLPETAWQC